MTNELNVMEQEEASVENSLDREPLLAQIDSATEQSISDVGIGARFLPKERKESIFIETGTSIAFAENSQGARPRHQVNGKGARVASSCQTWETVL